jgi:DNA invertase Pin-like site-specific DNA recombinase
LIVWGVMRLTSCKRWALADRNIKVIVHQLGNTDLTSAAGSLLLSMLAAVAEMERDLLIERTQAGLSRAKAEGKKLGDL